jgi:type II secretory pathway component PulF
MLNESTSPGASHPAARSATLLSEVADAAVGGAPLNEIFLALSEDATDRRLRNACRLVADELSRGASFREAITAATPLMPAYVPRALLASADSGNMAEVLQGLADQETVRRRLRRRIWSALLYPLLVVLLLAIVSGGLVLAVMPQFADLYNDFGLSLPASTAGMFALAEAIPQLLLAVAALAVAWIVLRFIPGGRRVVHWLRTGAPLFGRLWIWAGQHEFASVLGVLTAQGVTLPDALQSTAASLRDHNVARATRIVARKCEQGALLSRSLAESIHFDPALPALVGWGESNGALPEALHQAAAIFEEEIDVFAYFLHRALPPLLFAAVIVMVFGFMTVIVAPMINLMNNLM